MSFAPPESSEDTSLHHSEPELESGAPPARARNEFPAAPALPEIPALELPALTPPASSHFEHSPWPLGVADAAAEFAALKANAAAPGQVEEPTAPPVEQPSSPHAVAPVAVQAEPAPALPPESAVSAPEPAPFAEPEEPRASYDPFPVSFEQRSVTVADAPEPESAPAPSYEPPAVVWSPNPAPVAAHEAAFAAAAAPAAESDVSERVSVEWVPDQVAGVPSAQPQPDGGGYIERYQRLFAGDSVDPQQAILAALDAAIQAPSSDSTGVVSAPTEAAAPAAAAPASASVAAAVAAPQATPEPPPASSESALQAAARSGSDAPPSAAKLNLTRDVDWSEDVLASAARAAAVAAERARAQQLQAQADAALVSSQRVAAGLSPQSRRDAPLDKSASVRAEAKPLSTPVPSVQAEAPSSERGARHKARKQQARRARFVATPLFLFAFVGSVIFALGVGFVSGFMIGKETGKSAEQTPPRPAEPAVLAAAGPAAEPAASAAEGATARKKAGLNSRVEGVVPGANPAGGPEPGASAAGASAAANAKYLRGPFDSKLAGSALSKAAAGAGICVPPGDAGGEAVVTVTLDPSGVTSNAAVYGARFAGTQAGECIAGLLRGIKVRPFTGDPVTVKKTIQVN